MFSVIFEVQPRAEQWNAYLDKAKMLRPELEQIDGFVDNIRYRSLTREGLILSLSGWRDEKSLVRWRTKVRHHDAQAKGRSEILQNYHLRVGQVTKDNQLPPGHALCEQRLDETEVGEGTTITLINATRPKAWTETGNAADCAEFLGLNPDADGLVAWDVFDAVLTPGELILMIFVARQCRRRGVRQRIHRAGWVSGAPCPRGARLRHVRPPRGAAILSRRQGRRHDPFVTVPTVHHQAQWHTRKGWARCGTPGESPDPMRPEYKWPDNAPRRTGLRTHPPRKK